MSTLSLACLLAACGYIVWPTPWRYDVSNDQAARTHRLTSRVQFLTAYGWADAETPNPFDELVRREQALEALRKVDSARAEAESLKADPFYDLRLRADSH